ncbi:hypothetical protein DDZ13_01995 [Coraliomargarita sinensis]|uniref:Uncharacterized protein n=1 Tax=Coraliomargarita sinensis TaxID=2174842 RepID=A0A317ZP67_9BACT|nr:hypothetical protein [Coraliomargarita sinensis]PXA05668.1 hypothetical protein DDZ13_01995 [Coraliomargarita sinensis]
MHHRLVNYLRDNRDQIIENWLTEVEIPAAIGSGNGDGGVVPYEFFTSAFDTVLEILEHGSAAKSSTDVFHLNRFLGITCDCKERCFGGRACMELHDSGLKAFMSVFEDSWDAEHEFNELDRECNKDLINHALSGFFGREIDLCHHKTFRSDCPFVAHHPTRP